MTKSKRTNGIHGGIKRSQFGELSEAIFMTQGFAYDSAEVAEQRFEKAGKDEFIYARYGNPTVRMFEERIAQIEGGEDAFATASGMAAVHGALTAGLSAGDRIVSSRALFGSCLYILENILPRFGVDVEFVDGTDAAAWAAAITPDTKYVFFESMSNPTLEVIDVTHVCDLAHKVGALVIVDNVFTTPVHSKAFDMGVDVVVYSATKHIDGQGRGLGGVIISSTDFIRGTIEPYLKHTGGALSPFNAWIMLKGLETMDLRVRAQNQSALALAQAFAGHNALEQVIYPGLKSHPQHELCMAQMGAGGTVIALDFGSKAAAFRAINALEVISISNNLGDVKSLVTHPATTTHQRLTPLQKQQAGITDGLVRFSVGLEDVNDLIADLTQGVLAAMDGKDKP